MEFRAMHEFAVFFLALIACHLVLSVEGRLLKAVSKNDSNKNSQAEDHDQPAVPSYNPSAAHQSLSGRKEVLPPPTPTKSSDFAVDKDSDDFRPTTPGNSPGVGHSFTEDDEDVEQKPGSSNPSINGKHSTAGAKEDFRPTNPGHSPGVDHVLSKPKF